MTTHIFLLVQFKFFKFFKSYFKAISTFITRKIKVESLYFRGKSFNLTLFVYELPDLNVAYIYCLIFILTLFGRTRPNSAFH